MSILLNSYGSSHPDLWNSEKETLLENDTMQMNVVQQYARERRRSTGAHTREKLWISFHLTPFYFWVLFLLKLYAVVISKLHTTVPKLHGNILRGGRGFFSTKNISPYHSGSILESFNGKYLYKMLSMPLFLCFSLLSHSSNSWLSHLRHRHPHS